MLYDCFCHTQTSFVTISNMNHENMSCGEDGSQCKCSTCLCCCDIKSEYILSRIIAGWIFGTTRARRNFDQHNCSIQNISEIQGKCSWSSFLKILFKEMPHNLPHCNHSCGGDIRDILNYPLCRIQQAWPRACYRRRLSWGDNTAHF